MIRSLSVCTNTTNPIPPASLSSYPHQAPAALLRLPLHLHALRHPPASLHSLGFWPPWLTAATTITTTGTAAACLPPHELAALPTALAHFFFNATADDTTADTAAAAAAAVAPLWLEAALAPRPLPLSVGQWAEGLGGLSDLLLPSSSSLSMAGAAAAAVLSPFRPRVHAAVREALSPTAGLEVEGVPQLWAALASLGWLEDDGEREREEEGEGEESVVGLLVRAAERGVMRCGDGGVGWGGWMDHGCVGIDGLPLFLLPRLCV